MNLENHEKESMKNNVLAMDLRNQVDNISDVDENIYIFFYSSKGGEPG